MAKQEDRLQLGLINYIILGVAALLLVAGFVIMSRDESTISVLLLVISFVFLVPFGLLFRSRAKD